MGTISREKNGNTRNDKIKLSAMKIYAGGEIIEQETDGKYFSRPSAANSNVVDSNVSNNEVFEINVFLIVT